MFNFGSTILNTCDIILAASQHCTVTLMVDSIIQYMVVLNTCGIILVASQHCTATLMVDSQGTTRLLAQEGAMAPPWLSQGGANAPP